MVQEEPVGFAEPLAQRFSEEFVVSVGGRFAILSIPPVVSTMWNTGSVMVLLQDAMVPLPLAEMNLVSPTHRKPASYPVSNHLHAQWQCHLENAYS